MPLCRRVIDSEKEEEESEDEPVARRPVQKAGAARRAPQKRPSQRGGRKAGGSDDDDEARPGSLDRRRASPHSTHLARTLCCERINSTHPSLDTLLTPNGRRWKRRKQRPPRRKRGRSATTLRTRTRPRGLPTTRTPPSRSAVRAPRRSSPLHLRLLRAPAGAVPDTGDSSVHPPARAYAQRTSRPPSAPPSALRRGATGSPSQTCRGTRTGPPRQPQPPPRGTSS